MIEHLIPMLSLLLLSDILSPNRRISWDPGIQGSFPSYSLSVDVTDYGADGSDSSNDTQAFVNAIAAIPDSGGNLVIPAGTYYLYDSIKIDHSIHIKGAGADKTTLICKLGGAASPCLDIHKNDYGDWQTVTKGVPGGSRTVHVASTDDFSVGDFIELVQDNGPEVMYTQSAWNVSWAEQAVGQILEISAVEDGVLTLKHPFYLSHPLDLNPQIRKLGMIKYPSVEDLTINRKDQGEGHNILMRYVAYGRVLRVESDHSSRTHLSLNQSLGCEVTGSYFHHAYEYSEGGHGYGVDLYHHTTDCLVQNNVFAHLRHSMMSHVGSSGNVVAYNYSTGSVLNLCDISLHGHYSNYNLFESNEVEEIDIADYWGPAGPGNTFLRNRVTQEGIDVLDTSHYQNLLGNIVEKGDLSIDADVNSTFLHGNTVNSILSWLHGIRHSIPTSYYLSSRPSFLQNVSWPLIGPDVSGSQELPAQTRYEEGNPVASE